MFVSPPPPEPRYLCEKGSTLSYRVFPTRMLKSSKQKVYFTDANAIVQVVSLSCVIRYQKAIEDFDLAMKNLRGNLLIDYKQLGLMHKLYSCEV